MAGSYRSQVSRGPFIYMTSGQMATTDNRFIYEVYLCSHEVSKCIKVDCSVTTESLQNKVATLFNRVKRYQDKFDTSGQLCFFVN